MRKQQYKKQGRWNLSCSFSKNVNVSYSGFEDVAVLKRTTLGRRLGRGPWYGRPTSPLRRRSFLNALAAAARAWFFRSSSVSLSDLVTGGRTSSCWTAKFEGVLFALLTLSLLVSEGELSPQSL